MHHHTVVVNIVAVFLAVENVINLELYRQTVVAKRLYGIEVDRPHVAAEMHVAVVARTLVVGCDKE